MDIKSQKATTFEDVKVISDNLFVNKDHMPGELKISIIRPVYKSGNPRELTKLFTYL